MEIDRTCYARDSRAPTVHRSSVRRGYSNLVDGVATTGRLGCVGPFDVRDGKPSHCVAQSAPPN